MAKIAQKRVENKATISSEQAEKTGLRFKLTDSYASLVLGIVVIIVVIALGITIMKMMAKPMIQDTSSTSTVNEEALKKQQATYTIQEGDSLSYLAQRHYGDAQKWTVLAQENKISNPDVIEPGMKISIPGGEGSNVVMSDVKKIEGTSYTVVEGDSLWDIALRAYGDSYEWVEIAIANGLQTPDVISPGMTIKLPR